MENYSQVLKVAFQMHHSDPVCEHSGATKTGQGTTADDNTPEALGAACCVASGSAPVGSVDGPEEKRRQGCVKIVLVLCLKACPKGAGVAD